MIKPNEIKCLIIGPTLLIGKIKGRDKDNFLIMDKVMIVSIQRNPKTPDIFKFNMSPDICSNINEPEHINKDKCTKIFSPNPEILKKYESMTSSIIKPGLIEVQSLQH